MHKKAPAIQRFVVKKISPNFDCKKKILCKYAVIRILKIDYRGQIVKLVPFKVEIDDYKWKILPERLFGGGEV